MATGPEPFALSVLVLSGFVRIVTNARIFDRPSTADEVFAFIAELVDRPTARVVGPGPDHWRSSNGSVVKPGPPASWWPMRNMPRSRFAGSRLGFLDPPADAPPPKSAVATSPSS